MAALKELQSLDLHGCPDVTDVGLKDLAELKGLRKMDLRVTGVTDAGVADLRKALPDCEISR